MTNTAVQGRSIEYAARDVLAEAGYDVFRARASRGPSDLVAFKPGQVLFVSVKRTTPPGPAERADILRLAALLPGVAVPLVALRPFRQGLQFRRLTGPGPREWVPWTADEVTG